MLILLKNVLHDIMSSELFLISSRIRIHPMETVSAHHIRARKRGSHDAFELDYPAMIATVVRRRRERRPACVEIPLPLITQRTVTDDDSEFLFRLYASTRSDELALTGWRSDQLEAFLRMQFGLQHNQYRRNYPDANFNLIFINEVPAGRLYVERTGEMIRIIDISLLPEFRGKGAGGRILRNLVEEADAAGCTVSLHVEMGNPIRKLYKTLGFVEKEQRGVYQYMERCCNL